MNQKMSTKEIYIYLPNKPPYNDWDKYYANALGRIIKKLTDKKYQLEWFWFEPYSIKRESKSNDEDQIPMKFYWNKVGNDQYAQTILLRFQINYDLIKSYEDALIEVVKNEGCINTKITDYGWKGDLGHERFCGGLTGKDYDENRAELVLDFLHCTSKLTLSTIVKDGNEYRFERNDHEQNPNHSTFDSIHHLFCQVTKLNLYAKVVKHIPTGNCSIYSQQQIAPPEMEKDIEEFLIPLKF